MKIFVDLDVAADRSNLDTELGTLRTLAVMANTNVSAEIGGATVLVASPTDTAASLKAKYLAIVYNPPVVPPAPVPSPEGTTVLRGSNAAIIDAAGVSWTINASLRNGSVHRNGIDQNPTPYPTANVKLIRIKTGKCEQVNDANNSYIENGLVAGSATLVNWLDTTPVVSPPPPPVVPPSPPVTPPPPPVVPPSPPSSGAPVGFSTLVYSDDFDGIALKSDWSNQTFGPQHRSNFKATNVSVANSIARIQGYKLSGANGVDSEGGWFQKSEKFNMTECYAEARVRVTGNTANWNAAWWMYGGNPWPANGEFDILELLTRPNNSGIPLSTIHMPSSLGGSSSFSPPAVPDIQNWHVYGGSMKGGVARWYVDGKLTRSFALNATQQAFFATHPQMLMFCFYCDSSWTGGAAGGNNVMEIDWVKVWK